MKKHVKSFVAIIFVLLMTLSAVALTDATFPANIEIDGADAIIDELAASEVSIDHVVDGVAHAYVTEEQYEALIANYAAEILDGTISITIGQTYAQAVYNSETPGDRWSYYTYQTMLNKINEWQSQNSSICKVMDIGDCACGQYDIWALKVSDNVNQQEDELELFFHGGIHGNEKPGPTMVMYLLEQIFAKYGSDAQITEAVDNLQTYFIPIVNPHGHENSSRQNCRGVDLNRDYPKTWSRAQSETQAILNYIDSHNFVIGMDYHTSGQMTMIPWAHTNSNVADYGAFSELGRRMANSAGHRFGTIASFFGNVQGGSCDYQYGKYGIFSIGIEIGTIQLPNADTALQSAKKNYPAAIMVLTRPLENVITGNVTDYYSGEPVVATVTIQGIDDNAGPRNPYKSYGAYGRYHRLVESGNYSVTFTASGYRTQTVNVSASSSGQSETDIKLIPNVIPQTPTPTPTIPPEPVNVALNKPVVVSGEYSSSYPKAAINDGNTSTAWGSLYNQGPQWVYVDLGKAYNVEYVNIKYYNPYYSTKYYVGVSDNAVDWDFAATITNGNGGDDKVEVNRTTRYIGLYLTGGYEVYGILEFEVMSMPVQPTIVPTQTPQWTPGPTPTGTPNGDEWKSGVAYAAGDVVVYSGKKYRCVVAHTSNDAWKPGTPGVHLWEEV